MWFSSVLFCVLCWCWLLCRIKIYKNTPQIRRQNQTRKRSNTHKPYVNKEQNWRHRGDVTVVYLRCSWWGRRTRRCRYTWGGTLGGCNCSGRSQGGRLALSTRLLWPAGQHSRPLQYNQPNTLTAHQSDGHYCNRARQLYKNISM